MGDPITMAMIGAGVGAVTNPRKPLQGALLGGALGGFGGAAMGAGNVAATATGATAGGAPLAVTGVTPGVSLPVAKGVTTGAFKTATMPGVVSTNASTGLISSTTAPVTMMDRFNALGQFNRENPMVGQVGSSALQSLNEPQPMAASMQPGLLRGTPSQEQPMQYAMQMPQVSLI
jgi:hypothetical protein